MDFVRRAGRARECPATMEGFLALNMLDLSACDLKGAGVLLFSSGLWTRFVFLTCSMAAWWSTPPFLTLFSLDYLQAKFLPTSSNWAIWQSFISEPTSWLVSISLFYQTTWSKIVLPNKVVNPTISPPLWWRFFYLVLYCVLIQAQRRRKQNWGRICHAAGLMSRF